MQQLERLAYRLDEAARTTGISRSKLYEERQAGRLTFVKAGHLTLIRREELERFLNSLPPA